MATTPDHDCDDWHDGACSICDRQDNVTRMPYRQATDWIEPYVWSTDDERAELLAERDAINREPTCPVHGTDPCGEGWDG
jgi:hypothetical protein